MLWVLIRIASPVFMENWRKLSFNYHQIPSLSVLLFYVVKGWVMMTDNLSRDMTKPTKFCLFVLRLNVPVNNFSVMSGRKTNKVSVRPAKTQISLGIRPVWSEPSLCAQWVAKDPSFLHADSEDSDQTGRMPRLIWVFAECTLTLLVLSWGGSYGALMSTSTVLQLRGIVNKFPKCVCKHIKSWQKFIKFRTRIQQCLTSFVERSFVL